MKKSLYKDQRGLTPVVIILILVVLGIAVGLAAWRVMGGKEKNSSGNAPATSDTNQQLIAECNEAFDDQTFCEAAGHWSELGPHTRTIETSGVHGSSKIVMKQDADGNQHTSTTVANKVVYESITIGNASYSKDPNDNKWIKIETPEKTEDANDTIDFDVAVAKQTAAPKKAGTEACGDLTCLKYQIVNNDDPSVEQFVWFDDKDHIIRKYTYKGGEGITTITFDYSEVKITEPSPIKDVTSEKDVQSTQSTGLPTVPNSSND